MIKDEILKQKKEVSPLMYTLYPAAGGYFMVPAAAAEGLKLAGASQLKCLLAVCRRMGAPVEANQIAKETGLSPEDVKDALCFWIEKGLIVDNGEAPQKDEKEPAKEAEPAENPANLPETKESSLPERKKIPKIKPTTAQINNRCNEDSQIRELFLQAQIILGRTIGYDTQAQLLMCCDYLGLPVPVVLMICEYARSLGHSGIGYIVRIAENWAQEGILTLEAANERIAALEKRDKLWLAFSAAVHITNPTPSARMSGYLLHWSRDLGYSTDELVAAYYEMADHTGKFSPAYMDKVLSSWHEKGLKNIDQINAYLLDYQKQQLEKTKQKQPPAPLKKKEPATTSYDIQTAEQKAALGAPVYKRRKKK